RTAKPRWRRCRFSQISAWTSASLLGCQSRIVVKGVLRDGLDNFALAQTRVQRQHHWLAAFEPGNDFHRTAAANAGGAGDPLEHTLLNDKDVASVGTASDCRVPQLDRVAMPFELKVHVRIHAGVELMPIVGDIDLGQHRASRKVERGREAGYGSVEHATRKV